MSVPPDIDDLETSSDVIVNEGDDATLTCRASGHPKPQVRNNIFIEYFLLRSM